MSYLPYHFLNFEIGTCYRVLSDECELVSVWHECCGFMQYKVDAIL